jgi:predicted enzyme related to lactoylglutathione lyase
LCVGIDLNFLVLYAHGRGRGEKMKPRITVMTVGVDDLERSLTFYRDGLGLPLQSIIDKEVEAMVLSHFSISSTA